MRRGSLFTSASLGAEGVKGPNVCRIGGLYGMLLSYAPSSSYSIDPTALHATKDVYDAGLTRSHTGLATSPDGIPWGWEGDILSPSEGEWDAYAARLGSIAWTLPVFMGLYDGSRDVGENCEACCGLAFSFDLRHWERVTPFAPWVRVPYGSGSVRYVDVIQWGDRWRFSYEMSHPDGSPELRVAEGDV